MIRTVAVVLMMTLVSPALAERVRLSQIVEVESYVPVLIEHESGEKPTITNFDTGARLADKHVLTSGDTSVFTARSGTYLVRLPSKFGVVRVSGEDPSTVVRTVSPNPAPAPDEPDVVATPLRKIWVFTSASCPPCDQWKAEEKQKLTDQGVMVYEVSRGHPHPTPTFIVQYADHRAKIAKGYQSATQLASLIETSRRSPKQ